MHEHESSRRQFLHEVAGSGAALGLASLGAAGDPTGSKTGLPQRKLGRTGQNVSILALGGWHIGNVKDEKEAIRIMHAAIDEGINFFDNAWDYHDGRSEEVMGDAWSGCCRSSAFGPWTSKSRLVTAKLIWNCTRPAVLCRRLTSCWPRCVGTCI